MSAADFELDHVVVFSQVDAPERAQLEALGLRGFGGVTRHGDLGSASTSFFFAAHYLELIWAVDDAAARANYAPLGLDMIGRREWRRTGASPFGLMLRRRRGREAPFPFPTRRLAATWMPGEVNVEFAGDTPAEPYCGLVPPELAFPSFRADIPEAEHPLGVRQLTGVQITTTSDRCSRLAEWLALAGLAEVLPGPEPLLTLTFDDGAQGRQVEARPGLPVRLRC
ncbi:MAG: VOC family protein [Anaerolineales bacterium]|nr:VOC family protein [Anaerolineales bacterium]